MEVDRISGMNGVGSQASPPWPNTRKRRRPFPDPDLAAAPEYEEPDPDEPDSEELSSDSEQAAEEPSFIVAHEQPAHADSDEHRDQDIGASLDLMA